MIKTFELRNKPVLKILLNIDKFEIIDADFEKAKKLAEIVRKRNNQHSL